MMRWISLIISTIVIFPLYLLTTHVFDNFSLNHPKQVEESSPEPVPTSTEHTLNAAASKPIQTTKSSNGIKTEYINKLDKLEESVMNEFNQLEEQAESDFTATSNVIKRGAVLLKYERKAREIENNTDEQFTELIDELKQESPSVHTSKQLSQELTTEYEDRKSKLKSIIYEEVNAFLSES